MILTLQKSSRKRFVDQTQIDQYPMDVFGSHVAGVLKLKLLPFADDHAQRSGEALLAQAALIGDATDDLVVPGFEVDHAWDVIVRHKFPPGDGGSVRIAGIPLRLYMG